MLVRPPSAAAGPVAPLGRRLRPTLKAALAGSTKSLGLLSTRRRGFVWLGAAALVALAGCTPAIGEKCQLSTDCSISGDRLCDNSQPGGYCTVFGCLANSCPDHAACVLFHANVQGCAYDDRSPGRTAHSYCMAGCASDGDCRTGYVCRDPRLLPWSAKILDDDQSPHVCIVPGDLATDGTVPDGGSEAEPTVCEDGRVDAAVLFSSPDAALADGSPADAGLRLDASLEAAPPAEAALDGGVDAADATTSD